MVATYEFETVEEWYEPTDALMENEKFLCEMSRDDHGFLSGLIRIKSPKKIVEIGVAEGGTTSMIVKTLELIGNKAEMYSIDLGTTIPNSKFPKGHLYTELIGGSEVVDHRFLLGHTAAYHLENMGGDIDFVIIDTMHMLPGEILDFIAIFPYLSEDAIVVLHDVNLGYSFSQSTDERDVLLSEKLGLTNQLFAILKGKKYFNVQSGRNIAAIEVTQETITCMRDLFFNLISNWYYDPSDRVLEEYENCFNHNYSEYYMNLFHIAVENNKRSLESRKCISEQRKRFSGIVESEHRFPYEKIPYDSKIILYGAGKVGIWINNLMEVTHYCKIVKWVDKMYMQKFNDPVVSPDEIADTHADYILVATPSESVAKDIIETIKQNQWDNGKEIVCLI